MKICFVISLIHLFITRLSKKLSVNASIHWLSKPSGQVLKLLLENFGHLNELRQVDNIVHNENLLTGAQYIISMFNRDGRHKYRNKPFSISESRAEFETFYQQVTVLKESRNHHHASLEIFFNVEINKKGF